MLKSQIPVQKGTREVNGTGLLFDVEDPVLARPARPVPTPVVSGSEAELTPVAGVVLWGPLLDRLNVVAEADRRGLRSIGPGGYSGGACYRALVETLLAGGDFLSDRALLADPATAAAPGQPAAERGDAVALPRRRRPGPGEQGGGDQPGDVAPGVGRRRRPGGDPIDDRPGRHPGGHLRAG